VHYLATHPPGIEEIRRLTFQHSGQTEIQQKATYLKCSIKINHRPHSTLPAKDKLSASAYLSIPNAADSDDRKFAKEKWKKKTKRKPTPTASRASITKFNKQNNKHHKKKSQSRN
jgi:hypothetical protein